MGFSKFESAITGQIASLFQKRGAVEPSALIKALEREVVKQETKTDNGNVVPNDYTIFLCEEDCHRLSAARVIKALYEAVEKKVIRENCFMDGNLSVRIEKMFDGDDVILVKSSYVDDSKANEDTINYTLIENTIVEETEQTIVANTKKFSSGMKIMTPRQIEYEIAVLKADTGDEKTELILGERQVYIGRKDTNDLVLNDDGASRIHTYISYERHRHILHDAGSLNGTYVNRKPIEKRELQHGDKILVGSTFITYEVL